MMGKKTEIALGGFNAKGLSLPNSQAKSYIPELIKYNVQQKLSLQPKFLKAFNILNGKDVDEQFIILQT